jgi:hypothetical protein
MSMRTVEVAHPSPAGTDVTMPSLMLNGTHIGQYLHRPSGWLTDSKKFGGSFDQAKGVWTQARVFHSEITMITHRKDGVVNFRTAAHDGFLPPDEIVTVRFV